MADGITERECWLCVRTERLKNGGWPETPRAMVFFSEDDARYQMTRFQGDGFAAVHVVGPVRLKVRVPDVKAFAPTEPLKEWFRRWRVG